MDVTTLILTSIFGYLIYRWFSRRNLPPGPFCIPLFGNVGLFTSLKGKVTQFTVTVKIPFTTDPTQLTMITVSI